MKAVILAAGIGDRLRPFTDHCPKTLLTVGGIPILRRTLGELIARDFGPIVIVTGFLEQQIRAAVTSWFPTHDIEFISNPQYATTNNAVSLLCAAPSFVGSDFFLLDGDIVFAGDILDIMRKRGPNCLALRTLGEIGAEEIKVRITPAEHVQEIGKTVSLADTAGESIGIEYFSATASRSLANVLHTRIGRDGYVDEFYEASFQQMIDEGINISALDIGRLHAIEIDTIDDLTTANLSLRADKTATSAVTY